MTSSISSIIGFGATAATASIGAALAWGAFHPRSSLFLPVVHKGDPSGPSRVALTFDDGPCPIATPAILNALADRGVHATFFVIGRHAQRWPEIIKCIDDQGSVVANHTWDHSRVGMFRRRAYWIAQLERTDEFIEQTIGYRPAFFRPPMGFKSMHTAHAAQLAVERKTITWTRRAFDTRAGATPEQIVRRLTTDLRPGAILALHDGADRPASRRHATVAAVGPLIDAIHAKGFEIARLDHLINAFPWRLPRPMAADPNE